MKITKAGIADSIQDAGRYGWQHLGINPTGAMDIVAMQMANALVGNKLDEAVIELHFPASKIVFTEDCLLALSGADFNASINHEKVPINTPIIVTSGSVLQFDSCKQGARCYLAIQGGFQLEGWLGSFSTNIKANAGSVEGRFLQKDDRIELKQKTVFRQVPTAFQVLHWYVEAGSFYTEGNTIRVTKGNEFDLLKEASADVLEESAFSFTPKSDRMGYRLNGIPIQLQQSFEMLSSAVTKGTVQLLPDGQLIVLMADHQTTGGYPRVAHVITADLPKLAQMNSHETLQFQFVSLEEAEQLFIEQQQQLTQLQIACNLKLEDYFSK